MSSDEAAAAAAPRPPPSPTPQGMPRRAAAARPPADARLSAGEGSSRPQQRAGSAATPNVAPVDIGLRADKSSPFNQLSPLQLNDFSGFLSRPIDHRCRGGGGC